MALITVIMGDQSTRSYEGKVDVLEGGVLKIKPDDKQYPLVFLSAVMWLEVEQEQREAPAASSAGGPPPG